MNVNEREFVFMDAWTSSQKRTKLRFLDTQGIDEVDGEVGGAIAISG
jgi:hypothetical protein